MTTSPNVSATPTWVTAPDVTSSMTIAPVPMNTRTNVPKHSAVQARIIAGRFPSLRSPRTAGRRGFRSHPLGVAENGVDLPPIAVGIGEPEFVLKGVAAFRALLILGLEAARVQAGFPLNDFVHGSDADAEMREGARVGRRQQTRTEGEM